MIPLQWKQVEVINSMRTAPLPLEFVWVEATATQKCHIKEFRNDHAQGDFQKGITNCDQTHGTHHPIIWANYDQITAQNISLNDGICSSTIENHQ
jgi:hypothetical protein